MFAKVDKKGLTAVTEVKSQKNKKVLQSFLICEQKIIFVNLQLIEPERKVAVSYVGNRKSHVPILIRMYSWRLL